MILSAIYFRKVAVEMSARSFAGIYLLKDGFGLLREGGENNYFISLIFLDLHHHTLKKLHTVECSSDWPDIFVNQTDLTTIFLSHRIDGKESLQTCKIVDNAIIVKDVVEIDFFPKCFYENCVYGLMRFNRDSGFLKVRILNISS
jgi:hypothetical protein